MFRVAEINKERQIFILKGVNHHALAVVTRQFAWPDKGPSQYETNGEVSYERGDVTIPVALWIAGAARINIYRDRVDYEFGGALLHYGLSIFPDNVDGSGTMRIDRGIWFYSDNNKVPR